MMRCCAQLPPWLSWEMSLASSERSSAFVELVAKRLAFRPGELRRLNANEPAILAAHRTEFNAAIGLINSINTHEREYYEFVRRSFDALRKVGRPWRGRQNRLSRVLNVAPAVPLNLLTARS
jgi:hypothetical protein